MTLTRASAIALDALRTLIRDEIGDPAVDPAGNIIPASLRRWSDTQILNAANFQLMQMGNELAGMFSGDALLSADMSYGSGVDPADLPAGVGANAVYAVVDVTNETAPIHLDFSPLVSVQEVGSDDYWVSRRPCYTLVASNTTSSHQILVRPNSSGGRTLRVYYVADPYILAADADVHPLASKWRELVAVGAARKLLSRDAQGTQAQETRFAELWTQFVAFAHRQRGPQRVRSARRSRS